MGLLSCFPLGEDTGAVKVALSGTLAELGVALTGTESLEELVQAVRQLPTGDARVECFTGSWAANAWRNAYGYIELGRVITMDRSVLTLGQVNRLSGLTVTAAADRAGVLTAAGQGWTVTRTANGAGETVTTEYALPVGANRFSVYDALAALAFSAGSDLTAAFTLSARGQDSGTVFALEPVTANWARATWSLIEAVYPLWSVIEGRTFAAIENTTPPS